jgi:hypothetical protein
MLSYQSFRAVRTLAVKRSLVISYNFSSLAASPPSSPTVDNEKDVLKGFDLLMKQVANSTLTITDKGRCKVLEIMHPLVGQKETVTYPQQLGMVSF